MEHEVVDDEVTTAQLLDARGVDRDGDGTDDAVRVAWSDGAGSSDIVEGYCTALSDDPPEATPMAVAHGDLDDPEPCGP